MLHLTRLFTPCDGCGADAVMMSVVVVEVKEGCEGCGALVGVTVGLDMRPFFERCVPARIQPLALSSLWNMLVP